MHDKKKSAYGDRLMIFASTEQSNVLHNSAVMVRLRWLQSYLNNSMLFMIRKTEKIFFLSN